MRRIVFVVQIILTLVMLMGLGSGKYAARVEADPHVRYCVYVSAYYPWMQKGVIYNMCAEGNPLIHPTPVGIDEIVF